MMCERNDWWNYPLPTQRRASPLMYPLGPMVPPCCATWCHVLKLLGQNDVQALSVPYPPITMAKTSSTSHPSVETHLLRSTTMDALSLYRLAGAEGFKPLAGALPPPPWSPSLRGRLGGHASQAQRAASPQGWSPEGG